MGVATVLLADGGMPWALLILLVAGGAVWASGRKSWFVGFGLLAACAGLIHGLDVSERRAAREALGDGVDATRTVRLVETPKTFGRAWAAQVVDMDHGDRMRLLARGAPRQRGSVVEVKGRLLPPEKPRNPGEFDTPGWLDRQGVFAVLKSTRGVSLVEAPAPRWALGDAIRAGFRQAVTEGLDPASPEASVILAVVLGEHPGDDVLIEPFRLTGTLHVFAVSGLHVGMVGLMAWGLFRLLGVPRRAAIVPIILLMFGYAWLTGMKPPAVRAAWMAAVLLGAFWFRRRPDMGNALGLAALCVLLFDGDLIFTVGVQLSFGVVLAIGLLTRPVSRWWAWMEKEEPYLPRSLYGPMRNGWLRTRRWTSGTLSVSTAAWMGSAPLTAWHFGILTPIAVPASALLGAMVFPLLGLALIGAVLAPIPGVTPWLNQRNAALAKLMLGTAEVGAKVPGGHLSIPRDRPAEEFLLIFDVEGDGAACWFDGEQSALIDGGGRWSFEQIVMPSMRRMALRPTSMVATHPDGGHVGGLIGAMDAFPIERGLAPVLRALGPTYRDWLQTADLRGVSLKRGRVGIRYALSEDTWLEVLDEPDPWNWHVVADERVMPVRLHWRGWKILFMSDAGWAIERKLLNAGRDVQADVIVAGRHGRDASLGSRFLKASGAQAVVASHADFPAEERIPSLWRESTEALGCRVFHQGECGAVVISIDGDQLSLNGWLGDESLRIDR